MQNVSRRNFLYGTGAVAATCALGRSAAFAELLKKPPFKIAVINDEISSDLDHACSVAANDFGMSWIELRGMWGKNIINLDESDISKALEILAKYKLQVTDIASPLFKTNWPGAPASQYAESKDMHGAAEETFKKQNDILEKSIHVAKAFKATKIRCFDFWRIDNVAPYRKDINDKLREAAEKCGKNGITLVLENEFACNTATGRESAAVMNAVKTPHLALNWDPGNAVMRGELDAFPTAFAMIPKERIHHCHCKNAVAAKDKPGKYEWSPVDIGIIDWAAQFRALRKAGFRDAVSLETHWHGGGTPEQSTRTSWAGMKKNLTEAGIL